MPCLWDQAGLPRRHASCNRHDNQRATTPLIFISHLKTGETVAGRFPTPAPCSSATLQTAYVWYIHNLCSNGTLRKQPVTRPSTESPSKKPVRPSLTQPALTAKISTIRPRKRDDSDWHNRQPATFSSLCTRSGATAMKKLSASSVRDWQTEKKTSATKKRKIDYSDIPPLSDRQLASLRRVGRPPLGAERRQLIAIRLDPTVLRWVKSLAAERKVPYQSLINDLLAGEMKKAG
jgi:uncharacterized protein (DUF4415 family)